MNPDSPWEGGESSETPRRKMVRLRRAVRSGRRSHRLVRPFPAIVVGCPRLLGDHWRRGPCLGPHGRQSWRSNATRRQRAGRPLAVRRGRHCVRGHRRHRRHVDRQHDRAPRRQPCPGPHRLAPSKSTRLERR